jgi:hypothetical protein
LNLIPTSHLTHSTFVTIDINTLQEQPKEGRRKKKIPLSTVGAARQRNFRQKEFVIGLMIPTAMDQKGEDIKITLNRIRNGVQQRQKSTNSGTQTRKIEREKQT